MTKGTKIPLTLLVQKVDLGNFENTLGQVFILISIKYYSKLSKKNI